jgi:hypothetical protein
MLPTCRDAGGGLSAVKRAAADHTSARLLSGCLVDAWVALSCCYHSCNAHQLLCTEQQPFAAHTVIFDTTRVTAVHSARLHTRHDTGPLL